MEIKSLSWNTGDGNGRIYILYLVLYHYTIYTCTVQYSSYYTCGHLSLS